MASTEQSARVLLYPYQKAWIADESRFKLMVKSRQIGLSFGTTFRHVRKRLTKKGLTVWISASQRQSDEAAEYARLHADALKVVCECEDIEFPGIEDRARQITFRPGQPNEARMIFLPANPATMRGFAGDVVLDEFGFHRDAAKVYKAALAIVSRGYQLEIISTPNGQSGKYWDICKECGVPPLGEMEQTQWRAGIWSVHWCDIYTAVKQGCPISIDEMRAAAGDEDAWLQEYCCVFLADAENYIPLDLVISCESELASLDVPPGWQAKGDLFLGMDIGRRKDRSVIWLGEELGDVIWTRMVQVMQRATFKAQKAAVNLWMPYVRRGCFDTTGIGMQMGEELHEQWGSKVEPVEFNIANKEAMATATKTAFENREIRIPSAAFIRSSINAVKRYTSPTGHFRFDADRTDAGHADEFWALSLAISAASGPSISVEQVASRARQAHSMMGAYV